MTPVTVAWMTSVVKDGRLTVDLDGEIPSGWKRHLRRTLDSLGADKWGEITVKKGKVVVDHVPPGTEERLRHLLESAVTQANSSIPSEDDDAEDEDTEPEETPQHDADPDAELTATFRGFAG